MKEFLIIIVSLVLVFAAYTAYHAVSDVRQYAAQCEVSMQRIEEACQNGESNAAIASIKSASRFTMDIELNADPRQWPNSTLSKYYGIDVIGL